MTSGIKMGFRCMILADLAVGIGAGSIEIAQIHVSAGRKPVRTNTGFFPRRVLMRRTD